MTETIQECKKAKDYIIKKYFADDDFEVTLGDEENIALHCAIEALEEKIRRETAKENIRPFQHCKYSEYYQAAGYYCNKANEWADTMSGETGICDICKYDKHKKKNKG